MNKSHAQRITEAIAKEIARRASFGDETKLGDVIEDIRAEVRQGEWLTLKPVAITQQHIDIAKRMTGVIA